MNNVTALLTKHGLTEDQLTTALKKKIKDYRTVEAALQNAKQKVAAGNLSVNKKGELEGSIAEAEESLPLMETDLVASLEKWIPNREANKAKLEKMQAGKAAKTASKTQNASGAAAPTQTAAPAAPAQSAAPAKAAATTTSTTTPATPAGPAKKSNWLFLAIGVVLLVGTVGAVNILNEK